MSINSFAAVVGDNDGAAFITKAEFESLKNDFQSQINKYNSSLDDKIAGAIAAYLSGVTVAKRTLIKNLIATVSDIAWVNNFKIKGKMRTWTNQTTKTETAEIWQDYPADEKRNIRDGNVTFLFHYDAFNMAAIEMAVDMNYTGTSPVANVSMNAFLASHYGSPIHYMRLKNQKDLEFPQNSGTIFAAEEQITNASWMAPLTRNGANSYTSGTDWEIIANNNPLAMKQSADAVRVATKRDEQLISVDIDFNRGTRSTQYTMHIGADTDIGTYPRHLQDYEVDNADQYNQQIGPVTGMTETPPATRWDGGYFSGGLHLVYMSTANKNELSRFLPHMMFGRDNNQETNIFRTNPEKKYAGVESQFTTYSKIVNVPFDIYSVCIFNSKPWTADTSNVWLGSVPVTLGLPLLEKVPLKQIKNSFAEYAGNKLEMGKGIPLVVDNMNAGTLKISFDYEIDRLIDAKGTENRLYIDLKKSNFYDTANNVATDFYEGQVNGGTSSRIKDYIVNVTDNKVNIVIENFKVDDDIWMRVSPVTTTGGYYAIIDNLNLIIEST